MSFNFNLYGISVEMIIQPVRSCLRQSDKIRKEGYYNAAASPRGSPRCQVEEVKELQASTLFYIYNLSISKGHHW